MDSMSGAESCCEGQSQSAKISECDGQKGTNYFPISDQAFDVVTVVFEKSKALQAYDKYLSDCRENSELMSLLEEIKKDDRRHVERLKMYLGKC